MVCALNRITAVTDTMTPAKSAQATTGRKPSVSPEAATISGDGVSPAASAAAKQSDDPIPLDENSAGRKSSAL